MSDASIAVYVNTYSAVLHAARSLKPDRIMKNAGIYFFMLYVVM